MLRYLALTVARRAIVAPASKPASRFAKASLSPASLSSVSFSLHTSVKQFAAAAAAAAGDAPAKKPRKAAAPAGSTTAATTTKKKTTTAKAKPKAKAAAPKKKKKVTKPKAATKPKPKRVLHPPKPINSSWVLYFKERLDAMPKEEKKNVAELSKQLVEDFRQLPESEKASLDERLAEHKVKFEREMEEYKQTITPEMIAAENAYRRAKAKTSPKKRRSFKLLKDPSKPSPPLNGFFRFTQQVRSDSSLSQDILGVADASSLPFAQTGKAFADRWKSMSESQKEPYQSAYVKEKEVYDREIAEWKAKQTASA